MIGHKDIIYIFGIYLSLVKVHNNIDNFKATNPVVTIGTFDGLHLGHRKVLDRLKEIAK
ncbi:MAG: adenylyltransferase/cytidyltransferase family protein, partial [Prolixibacteraceae bacterium]|nr:adenylyltransferase/cytidyltransferase family protein [Prolixibacteraceae bacterium]